MTLYDDGFYDQITEGSVRSARKVVPHFLEVFKKPDCVVDVGCGTGAWLSVWQEYDNIEVHGIDGDYVDRNRLLIPQDRFVPWDLSEGKIPHEFETYPGDISYRSTTLAMSLEVAEHLPEVAADTFVASLCSIGDTVLFSAAVPGQNGVNHINEQWPSYWVPKFQAHGYSCSSNFRFDFWHDEDIENWYRQNILIFAKEPSSVMRWPYYESVHYWRLAPQTLDVIHYNNWMGKI